MKLCPFGLHVLSMKLQKACKETSHITIILNKSSIFFIEVLQWLWKICGSVCWNTWFKLLKTLSVYKGSIRFRINLYKNYRIRFLEGRFQENTILSIPTRLFPSLLTRKFRWQSPTYLSSLSRHSWLSWAALWVSGSVWGLSSCSVGASLRPPGSDLNIVIQCKILEWFYSVLINKYCTNCDENETALLLWLFIQSQLMNNEHIQIRIKKENSCDLCPPVEACYFSNLFTRYDKSVNIQFEQTIRALRKICSKKHKYHLTGTWAASTLCMYSDKKAVLFFSGSSLKAS